MAGDAMLSLPLEEKKILHRWKNDMHDSLWVVDSLLYFVSRRKKGGKKSNDNR
jgi:hypothetical protein